MVLWNMLTMAVFTLSAVQLFNVWVVLCNEVSPSERDRPAAVAVVVLFLVVMVAGPLCGWLADAKCGNYRIYKVGSLIMFGAAVLTSLGTIAGLNLPSSEARFATALVLFILLHVLGILTMCSFIACSSVSLQLGLDQMPDASSEKITSYVFWHLGSLFAGLWIGNSVYLLFSRCISQTTSAYMILSLFPVMFSGCALCTDFLLARKWLIFESSSPQSLRNIYRVLKFAAKHKAPLNRSALTYWEEDIPSRMDLAKTRYGGPFTTEQVEDVKTFLKLLVVFLPLWLIVPALATHYSEFEFSHYNLITGQSLCATTSIYTLTYSPFWCTVVSVFIHELCVWPLINLRYPSALKRIGIAALVTVVLNTAYLCWNIAESHMSIAHSNWFYTGYESLGFLTLYYLLVSVIEFICAQSPYSSRALLFGYTITIIMFSICIGGSINKGFSALCNDNCHVIHDSVSIALAIVGLILHCILAHWYKRRVRDDIDTPHQWVEEVYDRYLSHNHYQ